MGRKCKFRKRCEHYRTNSKVCNSRKYRFLDSGKPYCGKYNKLMEQEPEEFIGAILVLLIVFTFGFIIPILLILFFLDKFTSFNLKELLDDLSPRTIDLDEYKYSDVVIYE